MNSQRFWNPIKRRQAIALAGGALGGTVLHRMRFMETANAQTLTPINMGIATWIGYTPYHIAEAKGFFRSLGSISNQRFSALVRIVHQPS